MKRILLLLFTCLLFVPENKAQKPLVNGKIVDAHSEEAIAFAQVILLQETKSLYKTSTDLDGLFRLHIEPGSYELKVVYLGYKDHQSSFTLKTNDSLTLNIALEPKAVHLEAIETVERRSLDMFSAKGLRSTSSEVLMDVAFSSPVKSSGKAFPEKSGQLTAGQLNDFKKWDLWTDLQETEFKQHRKTWNIKPFERFSVIVANENSKAVVDAELELLNRKKQVVWSARTDNTGQAEMWNGLFSEKSEIATISIRAGKEVYEIKNPIPFELGINYVEIPLACTQHSLLDIAFVVDATGSMGDEINFLKAELKDVITRFKDEHPNLELRTGAVFYRDRSDEYLVRKSDLSADLKETRGFIANQNPNGGGDYPEAMDEALKTAIEELSWSENARARMLFVLADAPPHERPEDVARMHRAIALAAKKGIRIIPVTASGVNKSMEFLMRTMALASNGTYTFLTDHSGIGNAHIEPTVDQYDVEKLNELMLRLMDEYSFVPECNEKRPRKSDTLRFRLPNIIKTEMLNELWAVQYSDSQIVYYDTTRFQPIKPPNPAKNDSLFTPVIPDESVLMSMQVYPNPSQDFVQYSITGFAQELLLLNLSGKLIQRIPLNGIRQGKIDLRALPSGMYLLVALNREQKITGKIQKI